MTPEKLEQTKVFLKEPIRLHPELELTNADIERSLPESEIPKQTIRWMQKEGYPTYHIDTETRKAIVVKDGVQAFLLRTDSRLLSDFEKRYEI